MPGKPLDKPKFNHIKRLSPYNIPDLINFLINKGLKRFDDINKGQLQELERIL